MRLSLIEIVPHLVNMHTKASPTKDGTELQPSLLLSPTQLTSASLFFPFKQNRSPDALFFLASLCISFLLTFFFLSLLILLPIPPLGSLYSHLQFLLPSFLPPSSSSLQGSRRVWHFSNSRRGICTQPRPMLGKECGCGMSDRGECVSKSVTGHMCVDSPY